MTNRLAIIIGLLIVGLIVLDTVFDWGIVLFSLQKFTELTEWLAFWR